MGVPGGLSAPGATPRGVAASDRPGASRAYPASRADDLPSAADRDCVSGGAEQEQSDERMLPVRACGSDRCVTNCTMLMARKRCAAELAS